MKARWTVAMAISMMCVGAGGCTTGSSPTLPIPPPSALSSAPDADGFVTITGTGAVEGALIAAFNERLGEGVLGEADDMGDFSVRLQAQVGDSITVWQQVGTSSSELLDVRVPPI